MDALARSISYSSTGLLTERSRRRPINAFSASSTSSLIRFLRFTDKVGSSGCLLFAEKRPIRSLPPSSVALAVDEDASEPSIEAEAASKKVRVKFVLRRECLFGQQFLLVGDGAVLGAWDPTKAILLQWSDGHVWTVDLDLPVTEESVQFKFILRGLSGEIHWQPGPDRFLQTWETTNTIVVSEEWDTAENQKITEEDPAVLALLTDGSIVTGTHEDAQGRDIANENPVGETQVVQGTTEGRDIANENPVGESWSIQGATGAEEEEEEKNSKLNEADGVLVPGLAPFPVSGNTLILPEEVVADFANDCNSSQLHLGEEAEVAPNGLHKEEIAILSESLYSDDSEEKESYNQASSDGNLRPEESGYQSTVGVLRNDMRWVHKILHQLLLNLGFNKNASETT
ncbi:uncharacterized protein [Typha angustifolia]|uniref:uncharacterized protein n=1 Tax=Typha angustifolia TaxID=59011 RepID=UPI003C2E0513